MCEQIIQPGPSSFRKTAEASKILKASELSSGSWLSLSPWRITRKSSTGAKVQDSSRRKRRLASHGLQRCCKKVYLEVLSSCSSQQSA